MNKTKNLLTASIFVFLVFLFAPYAYADQMSMTAIPPKVELKGNPGQTLTATLKL